MKITICYITARRQPMFKWFIETLISQYPNEIVDDEILIIDHFIDYDVNREENLKKLVNGRFEYTHISPKPSIWIGKYRKTSRNFYDGPNTRNTGFIVCDTEYLVFVDDLTVLMPNWLQYHKRSAERKIIFSGAYDKVSDIVFNENKFQSYTAKNCDCRLIHQQSDDDINSWGGWAFGTNTGFPIEYILKVNGYDEFLGARRGGEDCNIGVRLENAGFKDKFFYNKNCLTIEDGELHYTGENSIDELYAIRRWKGDVVKNHHIHDFLSKKYNEMEHEHLYKNREYTTLDKNFNLQKERELYRNTKTFRMVDDVNFIDFDGETIDKL